MRKFTFFLALMVTMVTSAFAQGSEVIDIASNADAMLYSNAPCKVTTWGDDFKGWHVLFDDDASTFFHSDYSGDDSVDGLDHYLRVDMGEGNSVSLFTFTFTTRNKNCDVNSPTTIVVEGSNEADGEYSEIATLSGLPTTNSTVYTSETLGSEDAAYRYIRYRVTETKTNQTQGGKVFFFIAEFGMSKVKAGAVLANIKYTYTYNGETIGSATASAFVGDAYPEPTNVPFGYFAETPAGVVEGDVELPIECTLKLPFEYAETVDAIKTWYYIQMHSNSKKYIQYVEGENSIEWLDAEVAEGEENSYIWAFVGTPANGFKLVNYAAKVEMALCGNGEGNPAMGAYADGINWIPAASDEAGDNYFCLQYPNGNYMNAQNGKVAYWNDNDAGSTFVLTVAEPVVPVTFDIYSLDDNMNPSPLEGTVSKLGFVVFAASDNNAVLAEAVDAPKVGIFDPAMCAFVAEASSIQFGDLMGNGMQLVAVQFDGFSTPGNYMVYAPAGAFTVNGQPSEEIISAQFTIPAPVVKVFEVESVTPANNAEVEAIEKIEINFTENITLQQDPATYDFYTVNLVDENNNVIVLKTSDDANIWSKVVFTPAEPITAAGTYTLDLSQIKLDGGVCEGSYSWTVVAPAAEPGIDTSKEYYLYSSYNWGMNSGYLTIGTKSGSNYGPAYMANEKQQSFKLTPVADGGYTLSREADMGGMSYTEYIDCTHSYNVGNNAMSGSTLYFELNTNNKYNIRSANGYFKADMIDYGTDGYAYHVFSNGDMTSALEWELIPVEDVVDPEQPAAEPLNYVSHSPATVVESVSEVTITFDREVGSVSSDLSNVKLKLDTNVPARGMSSVINGNSITIYLNSVVKSSGEYTLEIPADIIKAADGGAFAGTTLTIIVDAAPTMTSKATVNVDNALSDITVEFDSEIEFATGAEKLQLIVKGTETVAAEFVVGESAIIEGNVLTLTLAEEIAPEATTKYDLAIPADFIVKKGSDKAFAGKTITYTVKVPFVIKNFTPASGSTVEALENIVIEYNENLTTYGTKTVLENVADGKQVEVTVTTNNNVATITPAAEVANGTYKLVNLGYIVSNSSWTAPTTLPEYTITIATPVVELEALEVVSADRNPLETAINGQYKLQGVKLNFDEVVKKYTTELTGDYGYILDAEGNEVAKLDKCMGGNGTSNNFATPYSATAIETPGTYKVVVLPGVILSADGTKEYKGGEFEFTVAERAVEVSPSAEEGFCWNETFENVADFSEFVITVKYAKSDVVINNEVKATMKTGETVYEAAVTVEKSGNTHYITLAFNGDFAEGRYSVDVPAGLFTVDGVANEAYVQSTFTYRKPQLEITRDFDTWESYLDQVWYMPTAAMITIANAESVVVNEEVVATIAVGENVYNSTLNWYYDEWSNAYYIEYVFEDFLAEGFEFAKGDYTFTLPAGAYTVNGETNEEAVKTYTYGDPIVEEFSVTEILPASGSVLESIDAIAITFSNGMKPDMLPITCGEKTYNFVSMSGVYVPVDMNYEPIVITEPGTYTLDLSELEGLTGDKVFSWTIAEAVEEPVDYTPTYTGSVERNDRNVTAVTLGDNRYDLLTPEQSSCYVDATETVTFTVVAGATVKANVEHKGEWLHHSVYIDFDGDGFTSAIEAGSEWKPAGDLVAYSFYNNNGSSDESGYNSVGTYMSGNDRHMPEIPEFVAPTEPGLYRIRFVQDWCSIDPNGDSDGKFGDFMGNGGQIVDVMLEVIEGTTDGIEEVETEAEKVIYDLTGRRILEITKSGIYVVNGKKVIVK